MKFALVVLAAASLYALPASKSEVNSGFIRKEDPKMLNRCVSPGCTGVGNYDSASSTGPVYRCNTCGNRWVERR
jgi:hypothetical protein